MTEENQEPTESSDKPSDNKSTETAASPKRSAPKSRRNNSSRKHYKSVVSYTTSTKANRVVLLCVGGAATVVLFARISGTPGTKSLNDPGDLLKIGIGTGATLIALMSIAEVAPDLAIHLALLILFGAVLSYGVDFATALSKGTLKPGIPATILGQK